MNRCLRISDITSLVCSELLDAHGRASLGDLARLARTCRALCDPALDILWRTLWSLNPLICTLPADLWESTESENAYGITRKDIFFLRPIKDTDWTRFLLYARRVRVLNFDDPSIGRAVNFRHAGVPSALHVSAPALPLLPNLQVLALNEEEALVPHLGMLLHPELTSFSCVYSSLLDLPPRISLLTSLPVTCPGLTSLTVYSGCIPKDEGPFIVALSGVVGAWRGLTQLDVPGLTSSGIQYVAALPSLWSLTLRNLDLVDTQHARPPLSFPSLRSIDICATTLPTCTAFLSLLPPQHPSLRAVKVRILTQDTPSKQFPAFFEALATHCAPLALQRIALGAHWRRWHTVPESGVIDTTAFLALLLPFHRLERLCVTVPSTVGFGDAEVRAMAKSWPRLRALVVSPAFAHPLRPGGISAAAFVDLVTSCMALEELSMLVDLRHPMEAGPGRTTSLRRLSTEYSRISDVAATAAFLSDVCPNLIDVHAGNDLESWREVTKLVAVRRKERATVEL
ncbi:hypothetical protein PLICRDRAFT_280623 [Plicaturopsis crispa FD-325 SS-3]|nr:hypothetical protein PLICRDRAFT_280623 [Plicaturopsis crispa FD-325 SS-3]